MTEAMRIGYLECFAGISGDMLMGALVDVGAPMELLQRTAASLAPGAELRVTRVNRSGIQSTKIDVVVNGQLHEPAADSGPIEHEHRHHHDHDHGHVHEHPTHHHEHEHARGLPEIRKLLMGADLTERARNLSLSAFNLLAQAEGRIHGIPPEEVHFHEVGAVDAIVDIACSAAAADALDLDRWYCSPVNVGSGFVNCAHGRFPVPAPATAELLKNFPVYSAHVQVELVTPTGAALLRALDCRFESTPVMRTQAIGYGAGTRNPERFPNVLRVSIGEIAKGLPWGGEKVTVLECAVDDLSPQVLAHTAQLALERGALDVMSAPVTMKKGRLGTLLTVLCKPGDRDHLQQLLFRETSTLGIRVREEDRVILDREVVQVQTEFGLIQIKTGSWRGEEWNVAPEFEDCRRAAIAFDVPLKTVMQAALAAWRSRQVGLDPAGTTPASTTLEAGSRS
jgi:pyridinium-3,5-bisthiocarboxylic acid mononucleotide nickel chelatase